MNFSQNEFNEGKNTIINDLTVMFLLLARYFHESKNDGTNHRKENVYRQLFG